MRCPETSEASEGTRQRTNGERPRVRPDPRVSERGHAVPGDERSERGHSPANERRATPSPPGSTSERARTCGARRRAKRARALASERTEGDPSPPGSASERAKNAGAKRARALASERTESDPGPPGSTSERARRLAPAASAGGLGAGWEASRTPVRTDAHAACTHTPEPSSFPPGDARACVIDGPSNELELNHSLCVRFGHLQ